MVFNLKFVWMGGGKWKQTLIVIMTIVVTNEIDPVKLVVDIFILISIK